MDGGLDASADSAGRRDGMVSDADPGDGAPVDVSTPDAVIPPRSDCGGPTALVDDFEDGMISDRWRASGPTAETGGALELTASGSDPTFYYSAFTYDLSDDFIAVRVDETPSAGSFYFGLAVDDGVGETISIDAASELAMDASDGSTNRIPYDRSVHQWLAVGVDGTSIVFMSSPDGVAWTTHHRSAAPSPLIPFRAEMGVVSYGSTATARVDDYNLDPTRASEPHCRADVVDMRQRPRFWAGDAYSNTATPGCVSLMSDGSMELALEVPSAAWTTMKKTCEYITTEAFDLREEWLEVHFVNRTLGPNISTYLALIDTRWGKLLAYLGNDWGWIGSDGTTPMSSFDITMGGELASYMRLGNFAGDMVLEVSLDGASWHEAARFPVDPGAFDPSAVNLGVGVDSDASALSRNVAVIEAFAGSRP